jgi:hypothetical protein
MIGKNKLSEIQADVAAEFAKRGIDPKEWFASRVAKLHAKKQPNEREVEALNLLRNAIASTDERELDLSQYCSARDLPARIILKHGTFGTGFAPCI